MIKHPLYTLFLILFGTICSLAQTGREALVELESMPIEIVSPNIIKSTDILELPFFDDFSRGLHYPAPELWEGKHVFINASYAINPKNIGVATFDAIDSRGLLHYNASNYAFSADTLASHAINLNYPGDTTIYISFYYQPQGYGNQPQEQDSLLLEFFDTNNDEWIGAWAASAQFASDRIVEKYKLSNTIKIIESDTLSRSFMRVHFPVKDARFLNGGFRLRFRNIASLSENQHVPSVRGNCDHWHIDLVKLDRNRAYNDTILNDITYYKPLLSILNNYESIPWKHFNAQAQLAELPSPLGFEIHYRNLGPVTWQVTRMFTIMNQSNGEKTSFSGGALNIDGFQDITYNRSYIYDMESAWDDSAKFTFTSYLVTDINPETYHLRWNDTVSYVQKFHNYYALDDGTAEMGYGLFGEGTQNARAAVKFNSYKADSLVGVYIYFNRTQNDANQKYFKLAIWNDNNGKPGDLIYEQLGVRPLFTDSLNRFTLFRLDESIWIEPGAFFVGWIQTTEEMLNMGFDLNQVNSDKIFFNITGEWKNTFYEGSLMLRPVFGSLTEPPTLVIPDRIQPEINIYPNPSQNHFYVDLFPTFIDVSIRVYNLTGQLVLSGELNNQPIPTNNLSPGAYIVQLSTSKSVIGTRKLIISR